MFFRSLNLPKMKYNKVKYTLKVLFCSFPPKKFYNIGHKRGQSCAIP